MKKFRIIINFHLLYILIQNTLICKLKNKYYKMKKLKIILKCKILEMDIFKKIRNKIIITIMKINISTNKIKICIITLIKIHIIK